MKRVLALVVLFFGLFLSRSALATHFHGNTVTWRVTDPQGAPNTVVFTITSAWTNADSSGTGFALDFGDGQSAPIPVGAAIGSSIEVVTGATVLHEQATLSHTYAGPGVYTAKATTCCRPTTINSGVGSTHIATAKVDLQSGNTGGPVATAFGELHFRAFSPRAITIYAQDPDLDAVTCRFATVAETGLATSPPAVPNGGAIPTLTPVVGGCILAWDLTNGTNNQGYAMALVFESTHNGVTSATPVEFLVELSNKNSPTCTGAGITTGAVGVQSTINLSSTLNAGTLTSYQINLPSGATLNPALGSSGPSPQSTTISWTPQAADAGTLRFGFVHFRDTTTTAGVCPLLFRVPECAGFGAACTSGSGACQSSGVTACNGTTPVCNAPAPTGSPETCNNLDDDCDGVIDDGNPQGGGSCSTGLPGLCGTGTTVCAAGGNLQCQTTTAPGTVAETCNNVDDDCDGQVDQGNPGGGSACSTGLPGVCSTGTNTCTSGALVCTATISPGQLSETCDAVDNDCDGQVDEGFNVGAACQAAGCGGTGVIVCSQGAAICSAGGGSGQGGPEVCNNIDDDCDGTIDNGNPGGGLACSTGLAGICGSGVTNCAAGGVLQCNGMVTPGQVVETCNGVDDDCDGQVDEGFNVGTACSAGVGACAKSGVLVCNAQGAASCNAVAGAAGTEICNNVDDDCDGQTDEGNPNGGQTCTTALQGVCATGTVTCAAGGLLVCQSTTSPGQLAETCNGFDDDCDGQVDEGFNVGAACSAGVGTCAASGFVVCSGGGALCNALPGQPGVEMCGDAADSDCDGDPDNGCGDSDGDGLTDPEEAALGTSPTDADTDDDGVLDGDELNPDEDADGDLIPNALDWDSDADGLPDGLEMGNDCSNPDTDAGAGHCIADADQGATTTDPLDPDTDGGTVFDGEEDANHNGQVDGGETDPNDPNDDPIVVPECAVDSDCGSKTSGKVCGPTQTCIDGCRASGNGCPDGQVCNSIDDTIGQCVAEPECATDTDCGAADSGLVCATAMCVEGCRGSGGNGCPEGQSCSSTDGTVGTCSLDTSCSTDANCGALDSGRICDTETGICVNGCRAVDGNGCASGFTCSSTDASPGLCISSTTPTSNTPEAGGGCSLRSTSPSAPEPPAGWLLVGAAAALLAARRRPGSALPSAPKPPQTPR